MGRPLKRKANEKRLDKRPTKKTKETGSKKDPAGTSELSFYSKADGKPMKKSLANVYKILSANTAKNWYEAYSTNPMFGNTANGFHTLSAYQTAAGSPLQVPLDLFDLTAVPNLINNVITYPNIRYKCQFSNETDSSLVSFPEQTMQKGLFLQNTVGAATNVDSFPEAGDTWVSTQIKMNLVGAVTVPMNIHCYLVQFKKDYLCPDVINQLYTSSSTGTPGSQYLQEATAFWQSMVKPLLYNPILVQSSTHMKDVKVLKHDVFKFEPKLSTEPQAQEGYGSATWPHIKTVSYFERMNRTMNYKWNDSDGVSLAAGVADVQQDAGDTRCTVEPKSRVYLMIAAEAFEYSDTNAFNNLRNASYDIMIKHKHTKVL
jgi:hypothetical protein